MYKTCAIQMASIVELCATWVLIYSAVFILLSGTTRADGERKCYWCGPLADQVHRSQRAPSCSQNELLQTKCDEGYSHCAIVATSPPYIESRLCIKFYQDECYSLYCNSTQTWRMVCPCRGDLCNGPNTDREITAFSTLRTVKKNKPRNIRSTSKTNSGFINMKTRTPRNNTNNNMTNEDTIVTSEPPQVIEIHIKNTTTPPLDLKQYNEGTIIEHGSTVSVGLEDNNIDTKSIATTLDTTPYTTKIEEVMTSAEPVKTTESNEIPTTTVPMKLTTIQVELLVVQNETRKDVLPPAEALQQNVTPSKAMETITMASVVTTTTKMEEDKAIETTTVPSMGVMKKNLATCNVLHLPIIMFGILMHFYF